MSVGYTLSLCSLIATFRSLHLAPLLLVFFRSVKQELQLLMMSGVYKNVVIAYGGCFLSHDDYDVITRPPRAGVRQLFSSSRGSTFTAEVAKRTRHGAVLVMEAMPTDLSKFLKSDLTISKASRVRIALEVIQILRTVRHSLKIAHSDIKVSGVLPY